MGEVVIEATDGSDPIKHLRFKDVMQLNPGAIAYVRPIGMPAGFVPPMEALDGSNEVTTPPNPSRAIRLLGRVVDVVLGPEQGGNDRSRTT